MVDLATPFGLAACSSWSVAAFCCSAAQHALRHLSTWWMMDSRSTGATITMLSAMTATGASTLAGRCMLQSVEVSQGPDCGAWPDTNCRDVRAPLTSCSSLSPCRSLCTADCFSSAARIGRTTTCEFIHLYCVHGVRSARQLQTGSGSHEVSSGTHEWQMTSLCM